ncbi:hypothetical protein QBC46DRAFT_392659 [Diplogelasinospora grovesii]|uniref:ThuA-like domain-containing protein n=1 Tax=Diplogelasinospora grovesii TaxID=303347 RepID=A0AAN6N4U6_9PEZI|nr:hypothetical protein QBC46DRAFT_392659 [Diplogelasinospora grovesii]
MDRMPPPAPFKVLVFSATAAFRHESIPSGIAALQRLSAASQTTSTPFSVDCSEDAARSFNASSLAQYRVVVLLQASGEFLTTSTQIDAFQAFVRAGGGVVGVHCASFAMQSDDWYGRMIGAVFDNHPEPQRGRINIVDPTHPIITASLGNGQGMQKEEASGCWKWDWLDEWYNFKMHPHSGPAGDNDLHVLLTVDETSYSGGTHGEDHPVAWCQEFDGGRSFYAA